MTDSATSPTHEGFTVGLALVDAIPVLLFGVSVILIGARWGNAVFLIGAVAMFVGGASKVLWKLLIGLGKGDKPLLAKLFRPCMFGGFALVLISVIIGSFTGALSWPAVGRAIVSLPALVFFILAVAGMTAMGVLAKKMDQTSARANWTEQLINAFAQLMLLLGIVFAV